MIVVVDSDHVVGVVLAERELGRIKGRRIQLDLPVDLAQLIGLDDF